MPSSYTGSLRLTLPVTGELANTWGDTVNVGITTLVDTAVAGYAAVAMTDANYTLTSSNGAADESRNMYVNMTGALTAARNVICPTASKLYFFKNSTTGGFAVTLKTSGGTGISVPNGKAVALFCDGTNVVDAITYLAVANGGTGQSSYTDGQLLIGNTATGGLSKATLTAGANITITNGNGTISIASSGGGGGSGAVTMQTFTTNGTYTPTSGMTYCIVHMVGGGAGGAQITASNFGGAGGGAGEYATGVFTAADIGASKAITVGTGGAANSGGGTTSLGSLLTAVGAPLTTNAQQAGGLGGTGGTGTGLHVPGGSGATGSGTFSGPIFVGGSGGCSFFGSGGRGGTGNIDNGAAGLAYGSGGGGNGAISTAYSSAGAGAGGAVIIYEYQ